METHAEDQPINSHMYKMYNVFVSSIILRIN